MVKKKHIGIAKVYIEVSASLDLCDILRIALNNAKYYIIMSEYDRKLVRYSRYCISGHTTRYYSKYVSSTKWVRKKPMEIIPTTAEDIAPFMCNVASNFFNFLMIVSISNIITLPYKSHVVNTEWKLILGSCNLVWKMWLHSMI